MTKTTERRGSARFPAVAHRIKVEWWEGLEAKSANAKLVNISRDGALLAMDTPPPVCQSVWLKLEDGSPMDWIGANVVRHDSRKGAGLLFPESCPFDFYQSAILGIGQENLDKSD